MPDVPKEELVKAFGPGFERIAGAAAQPVAPDSPGFLDVLASAGERENVAISLALQEERPNQVETGFSLFDSLKGRGDFDRYQQELLLGSFDDVHSEADLDVVIRQVERERRNTSIIQNAGLLGFAATIGAAVTSPENFLPLGTAYRSARVGRSLVAGGSVLGETVAIGTTSAAIAEGLLHQSQETRTVEESMFSVAAAGVFSGLLGGLSEGFGKVNATQLKSLHEFELKNGDLTEQFVRDNPKFLQEIAGVPAEDQNRLFRAKIREIHPDYARLPVFTRTWAKGMRWNPIGRLATSENPVNRVLGMTMSDTPWIRIDEAGKEITAASVESMIHAGYMRQALTEVKIKADIYRSYRKDGGPLRFRDFSEQVGKALRNGDKAVRGSTGVADDLSATAVGKAAKQAREFLDEFQDLALKAGLISDTDLRGTDETWIWRIFDTEAITRDPDGFVDRIANWIVEDSHGRRSLDEAKEEALSIREDLMKTFVTRNGFDSISEPNSFRRRSLRIPSAIIDDFLVNDVNAILRRTARSLIPDIELARAFSPAVSNKLRNLLTHMNRLNDQTPDANVKQFADRVTDLRASTRAAMTGDIKKARMIEELLDEREALEEALGRGPDADKRVRLAQVQKERDALLGETERVEVDLVGTETDRSNSLKELRRAAADLRRENARAGVEMTQQRALIAKEWKKRFAKGDPKNVRKLRERARREGADVQLILDRLRNQAGVPQNPESFAFRIEKSVRQINFMRFMGGVTLSSLPDTAMPVFVFGLSRYARGLRAVMKAGGINKLAEKDDLIRMVAALEYTNSAYSRIAQIADISELGVRTTLDKIMDTTTDAFARATLINQWNGMMKALSSAISSDRLMQAVLGELDPKETSRIFALAGWDPGLTPRIRAMISKNKQTDGGFHLARTQLWKDVEARRAFEAAVVKDVRRTIVTPSAGDLPTVFSIPGLRLLTQFRSFSVAATNRVLLSGIQRHDAAVAQGMILASGMGMMTWAIKEVVAGRDPTEKNAADWVINGIDRSGMPGIFGEVNGAVERLSSGTLGLNPLFGGTGLTRFQIRNSTDAVFGPSVGTIEDMQAIIQSWFQKDEFGNSVPPTEADINRMRKFVPFASLFYIRGLFNALEGGGP